MNATAYSPKNAAFSEAAHEAAKRQIYPSLFRSHELEFESTLVGSSERNNILDGQMAVDRIVKVKTENLRGPLSFTVQERFRQPKFQKYKDLTVTEYNHSSGQLSELYKVTSGLFVYGYFDEVEGEFLEVISVNTCGLLFKVARGEINYTQGRNPRSNQTFFGFTFDALKTAGLVDFHFTNGYATARAL